MTNNKPIRRGALSRGLSLSIAGARAGGAFAFDSALRKLRGEEGVIASGWIERLNALLAASVNSKAATSKSAKCLRCWVNTSYLRL